MITFRDYKTAANMNLGFTVDEFIYQYANGNNRLTMADGINGTADRNYTYDANGNLLTDSYKSISATQYIRGSYANQITKGSDQITYQYDASDLRYYKKVVASGVTTEEMYVKDALGRELAIVKWVGNNSPTTEYYVFGSNRIATVTSSGTAQVTPNEATFFLYDHLGNTRVAFQYSGSLPTIVNAMDYYPYGKTLRVYDNGNGDRYLTSGHERDGETGLDYRGARYYDSDLGRFLSVDPLAAKFPQWTTYNYCLGNPIIFTDPDGRRPLPVQSSTYNGQKWRIESGFGARNVKGNAKASKFHRGADINAGGGFFDYGAPIVSTHDGTITAIHESTEGAGGRYITVTSPDGNFQTKYLHLSKTSVKVGQKVSEGDVIGELGASAFNSEKGTASHLHYDIEVLTNGKFVKIDPQLDSDQNANTNNNINNLLDPQLWITGGVMVGTRDIPSQITDLEEVVVTATYIPSDLSKKSVDSLQQETPVINK